MRATTLPCDARRELRGERPDGCHAPSEVPGILQTPRNIRVYKRRKPDSNQGATNAGKGGDMKSKILGLLAAGLLALPMSGPSVTKSRGGKS